MSTPLARPLLYLTITHPSGRMTGMNWWLPAAISALLVCAGAWLAPQLNLFHAGGLFDKLLGFVQNLPGFYIAALAAVATFGKPGLDAPMPGTPPRAAILFNGKRETVDLSRRRFLCLMFSYLTALSIGITLSLVAALTCVDPAKAALAAPALQPVRALLAFVLLLLTAQLIVITLWGLYYLGERMHTPDR